MQNHHFHWFHQYRHFPKLHKIMLDESRQHKWKAIGNHNNRNQFMDLFWIFLFSAYYYMSMSITYIGICQLDVIDTSQWLIDILLTYVLTYRRKFVLAFIFIGLSCFHLCNSGFRHQNDSLLMIYYHDQTVAIGKLIEWHFESISQLNILSTLQTQCRM